MKEILFRGKRTDGDELIESNSIQQLYGGSKVYLWYQGGWIEVISKTVCEYTGLTDKNRRKIFEGDILKIITTIKGDWIKDENGNYKEPKRTDCAIVQEDKNTGGYKLKVYHNGKYKRISKFTLTHIYCYYKAEVIGNIHDDPELLEKKK